MCGRFANNLSIEEIKKLYYATPAGEMHFTGSYNIAPTESVPLILERDGEREIRFARFGMQMNAGGKVFPLINLQSEKVGNRQDFKTRRCIIPATGFYEWEKISPKEKQPYYFSPLEGHFAFAGVWKQEKTGLGFSIFTTCANETVAPVHARMPVILTHNAAGIWLSEESAPELLNELMSPYPSGLMQAWRVSKAVNSPKNKDAACINSL